MSSREGVSAAIETSSPELLAARTHSVFHALQDHSLRVSWKAQVREPLMQLFDGRAFDTVRHELDEIHRRVLKSRVFLALHMHAGDGNVHTNIPVNSDDYAMLQEANQVVSRVMALAKSLGGVISGEHGIGITKLDYLEPDALESFAAYKHRIDPEGRFNKGKLLPGANLERAYTPSFSLLEQESLILEQSDIGAVSDSIKDCLRCGKCKPVCSTHVPRANLLYSPRNKILATSLLIEAFLYEEQTRRGISIRHFDEFSDVADHCTVCHKCESPCPVDIDFGDRVDRHAQHAAQDGQAEVQPGHRRRDAVPQCHRPKHHKAHPQADDRLGLPGAAYRPSAGQALRIARRSAAAPTGHAGQAAGKGADHPLHQQADAGRPAEEDLARVAGHRGPLHRAR